jgi:hypothetical protein
MRFGRLNIVVGAVMLLLGALGGLLLGATFDAQSVKDGVHVLPLARFFVREGHSHTMPFALLNLCIGLLVDRLALSDVWKRACSWLAVLAFVLPIGLEIRGLMGAPADFPPIPVLGVVGFIGAVALVAIGMRRAQ